MMSTAFIWIPVAFAITAVIVGSLIVASLRDHRRHQQTQTGESVTPRHLVHLHVAETRRRMGDDVRQAA